MSQLFQAKAHRCQIDCSNHDQVINALQMKSKDLYYFWRNYQWLYNQYYTNSQLPVQIAKPKENHDNCQREIESLEQQNDRLLRENKKLKMQLQTIRKQQLDQQSHHKLQITFKQQLAIQRNKVNQYVQINEKLMAQNKKLKNSLNTQEDQHQTQRTRLIKQNKKALQTIIQLQQSLDQLRAKSSIVPTIVQPVAPQLPSYTQIQQFSRRQTMIATSKLRNLAVEAESIVATQCEGLRRQLEERLSQMLAQLSQRELQTIIVSVE